MLIDTTGSSEQSHVFIQNWFGINIEWGKKVERRALPESLFAYLSERTLPLTQKDELWLALPRLACGISYLCINIYSF